MESSSTTVLNDNTLRLEGPKIMQQAMQTFQTDAAAPEPAPPAATQNPPSQLPNFPPQFLTTIPMAGQPTQQQQIQWQQALQTLAAVQTQPVGGFGATPGAAVPFLASLTIPHLMQFNTLQQQQQQQVANMMGSTVPIQHAMPPPPATSSLTTSTNGSNNKRRSNRMSEANSHLNSSSERSETRKMPKRSLNAKKDSGGTSAVISLSGGSHSTSVAFTSRPSDHIDGMDNLQPPQEKSAAAIEKMSAAERRRYERNLREQQRSYRISQQIKELRDVLQESNVPFRPNKYSILVSVAEYIQQLQARAIMLDSEHQRLIDTIRNTTEATSSGGSSEEPPFEVSKGSSLTSSMNGDGPDDEYNSSSNVIPNASYSDANLICPDSLLVPGIDYESVFFNCPYPLGVATLDGRIIAANNEFELLLNPNYDTAPMKDQSFFVFIRNHQDMFEAMAAILKQSTASIDRGEGTVTKSPNLLFWHGQVVSSRNEIVRLIS